ncbi:MAG: sigma-70 family RNA polymerase sigma factor [Cyclobacteriaceae bacterium]|jgi:RNA polymerase sigma factor (sigma-70 family)|nr:sigma-70 family RNA polymerase sigma factor [Flammeovirgaceae bacterium]MCZ8022650.1 sigma-70 family RNA polymerase sigma factor [Cytophagales bacterium]MCZ8328849.1 sigma-70 family RNA polymerase sigma factor [Cyclobacteriaceae bacterium]
MSPLFVHYGNEEELILGCKQNKATAQKQVYEIYSGKMYALCCRYVKNKMEAEDVLVTAFTKVFERIDQFRNEGSFEGWIRRVVVNEALTWIRRNKTMYLETDLELADHEPNYQQLDAELQAEDLVKLIQQLPAGYQLVFNLYAIDGYTHKEIADQLNISENTSKSQLSRARTYLQKMLINYDWKTYQNNYKHDETAG